LPTIKHADAGTVPAGPTQEVDLDSITDHRVSGTATDPDRVHAVAPWRPDVDVAWLLLLAGRDFDSARERTERERECRPVWPGLHRDGALVGMRDTSDNR
jgi:hypothetical protein